MKALQNVTDDISHAQYEIDRRGDRAVSKLLQQALDDVAVTKYLSNSSSQERRLPLFDVGAGGAQRPGVDDVLDVVEFDHDPLTEEDLALIQAEEDQMADLALS